MNAVGPCSSPLASRDSGCPRRSRHPLLANRRRPAAGCRCSQSPSDAGRHLVEHRAEPIDVDRVSLDDQGRLGPATCRYARGSTSAAASAHEVMTRSRTLRLCTGRSWIAISSSRRIQPEPPAGSLRPARRERDAVPVAQALLRGGRHDRADALRPRLQCSRQVGPFSGPGLHPRRAAMPAAVGRSARSPAGGVRVRSRPHVADESRGALNGNRRSGTPAHVRRRTGSRQSHAGHARVTPLLAESRARHADGWTHPAQARDAAAHRVLQVPRRPTTGSRSSTRASAAPAWLRSPRATTRRA